MDEARGPVPAGGGGGAAAAAARRARARCHRGAAPLAVHCRLSHAHIGDRTHRHTFLYLLQIRAVQGILYLSLSLISTY